MPAKPFAFGTTLTVLSEGQHEFCGHKRILHNGHCGSWNCILPPRNGDADKLNPARLPELQRTERHRCYHAWERLRATAEHSISKRSVFAARSNAECFNLCLTKCGIADSKGDSVDERSDFREQVRLTSPPRLGASLHKVTREQPPIQHSSLKLSAQITRTSVFISTL